MKKIPTIVLPCLTFINQISSQEEIGTETEIEMESVEEHYKHIISLGLGHAHVSQGVGQIGKSERLILPS